jgi:hypothetical protein
MLFKAAAVMLPVELLHHIHGKILGAAGRGDHPVGHGLLQLRFRCPGVLRDREVLLQSGRAADRHGAADPDQLAGLHVKHLGVLEVENLFPDLHRDLLERVRFTIT